MNQAILKITSNLAFGFSILYQRLNFNAIQKSASNVALDRVEDKVENVEEGQGRRKSRRITVKAETVAVKVEEIGPLIGHEKIPALLEELGKCK